MKPLARTNVAPRGVHRTGVVSEELRVVVVVWGTEGGVTVSRVSSISVVSSVTVPLPRRTVRAVLGAGAGVGFTTVSLDCVVVEVMDEEGAGEIVVVVSRVMLDCASAVETRGQKARAPASKLSKSGARDCSKAIL